MPKFFYISRDASGNKVTGTEESANQDELITRLQSRNLIVVSTTPVEEASAAVNRLLTDSGLNIKFKVKHYGIKSEDMMLFCRQLATLLGAGVTIFKSLDIISKQIASKRLFNVIKSLQRNMEAGLSFHESLAKHPDVFSELWINLVESGEASGNLAFILNRLAIYLEKAEAFKRKIVSALIYPVILLAAGIGALMFLTIKIIPTFAELFKGFNTELPVLTQILVCVSSFVRRFFIFFFLSALAVLALFRSYIKTKSGRRSFEKFLFRMPVFGEFFRVLAVERFTSEMATLVESGVPILYSLEIAEHSVGNLILADIIHTIKEGVRNGRSLSQPMEESNFFEPMAIQMVAIGEEIGELPDMFKRLNIFYQDYADTFLTRFTTMFEPLMLLFMGLVIGIMVIGMFLPIFQIAKIH
ncbi:MAG: type II secretion system F family protein [Candidatus Omnitrophota bacterium]|jgi:type IV pilus assembly protein PilC